MSHVSLCRLPSRVGRSLSATLHDALSARGFDLVVNRFSQQIQQLVPYQAYYVRMREQAEYTWLYSRYLVVHANDYGDLWDAHDNIPVIS